MSTYPISYSVSDCVTFARALKTHTDIGDKLVGIAVDQAAARADCTFEQGDGQSPPQAGNPLTYDLSNGVAFARALKTHTDNGDKLVKIAVNTATTSAECAFE